MIDTSAAKTAILKSIRTSLGPATPAPGIEAEWGGLRRGYRSSSPADREALLHQLEDRLRDYDAGVYRSTPEALRELLGKILVERGKSMMAVPAGFPQEWLPSGVVFVEDEREDVGPIDLCEGVLTTATLAIAETGTIVLQDAPGQGRRAATLLPDYHLCVVDAGSIVQSVPQAMAVLQPTAALATTFFSGPSATADIEMTRIKGVHGPRFVDVVLIV